MIIDAYPFRVVPLLTRKANMRRIQHDINNILARSTWQIDPEKSGIQEQLRELQGELRRMVDEERYGPKEVKGPTRRQLEADAFMRMHTWMQISPDVYRHL